MKIQTMIRKKTFPSVKVDRQFNPQIPTVNFPFCFALLASILKLHEKEQGENKDIMTRVNHMQ